MSSQEGSPEIKFFPSWEETPETARLIRAYADAAEELPEEASYEDLMRAASKIGQKLSEEDLDEQKTDN